MRRGVSGIVLLILGAAGCSTGDSMFPHTGTLRPQVLDLTLSTQTSAEPSNQFMKWTVVRAEADVPGVGTVNLLTKEDTDDACLQVQQIFAVNSTSTATCRFELTGLALEAGTSGMATVRLEVRNVWVTRAERPVSNGDADGDLIPDEDDNCPYISNPEQENENADEEGENPVGDACTNTNGAKDSDADGVADVTDNCVYVKNPAPQTLSRTDGVLDTVGVECAEKIQVTPVGSTVLIRRSDLPFTIRDGGTTFVRFDFRSTDWCPNDPDHTTCTLTADDVTVSIQ